MGLPPPPLPPEGANDVEPARATAENLEALKALRDRASNGDAQALGSLLEVVMNFSQWRQTKDRQGAIARECKDLLEQEEGTLREAIEAPIQQGSTPEMVEQAQTKLHTIEKRWQQREETKQACESKKREAKKAVRAWADKLDRSIQDGAQLTLNFRK
jgi:hypothetical protein